MALIWLALSSPLAAFAQSGSTLPVENENQLISALASLQTGERAAASAQLKEHKNLVTTYLWTQLIFEATKASSSDDSTRPLFLCGVAKEAAGEIGEKKLVARALYVAGQSQFQENHFKVAIDIELQSLQAFEEAGARKDQVSVLSELGSIYYFIADYQKAKEYSLRSIALADEVKDSDEAQLMMPVKYGVAVSLQNLGNIGKGEGDYDEAVAYLQRSSALLRELAREDAGHMSDTTEEMTDVLADTGRLYRVMGDNLRALMFFNQAMDVAKTLPSKDRLAGILNSIGVLYIRQGDYTKASDVLSQSLLIFTEENNQVDAARVLVNIGVVNQRQGKYGGARSSFEASLRKVEAGGAPDIAVQAQEGIGSVYQEEGDYRSALEWLGKSLSAAESVGDKSLRAEILWREAEAYRQKGDLTSAIKSAGLAANLAAQLRLPVISSLALTTKGRSYLALRDETPAFEALSSAVGQIEQMRLQVAGGEQQKQLFFENKVQPYYALVDLLVGQKKFAQALHFAEAAKGRVLLDVLRGGKVNVTNAMTPDEKEQEKKLDAAIVGLNTRLREENAKPRPDEKRVDALQVLLQKARLDYESFQTNLFAAHPELKTRRGESSPLTLEDAASLIPDAKTALLEFAISEENTYLFVITKDLDEHGGIGAARLQVYPLAVRGKELASRVARFRRAVTELDDYHAPARELYDLLLKPAERQLAGKTTLCVVPDGVLWEVPFQALQPAENRFLIEDRALFYSPSLGALREMIKKKSPGDGAEVLLAVGNPTAGTETSAFVRALYRTESFGPLPEAEKEVRNIAQIYGSERSKVLTGSEARESVVRREAPRFRVLHFATHAVLDDNNPLYSYVVLANSGGADEDGLLEAREMLNLNLNADLAVLSACETARGRVSAGEGVIGMSWALFVAGVPSTVVSQWKVDSASTADLMIEFHRKLAWQGKQNDLSWAKAAALRAAALSLIKEQKYRHPFYWAGFVLIGNGN